MGTTIIGNNSLTDSTPNSKLPSRCATPASAFKNISSLMASPCGTPDTRMSVSVSGGITRIQPKRFASPIPSNPSSSIPTFITSAWQCDNESLRASVFWIFTQPPPHTYEDPETPNDNDGNEWAVDDSAYDEDYSDSDESTPDPSSTPTLTPSMELGIPFPTMEYSDSTLAAVPVLDEAQRQRNLAMIQDLPIGTWTRCDGNCDCCKEDYLKVEKNKRRAGLFNNVTDKVTTAGKAILSSSANGVARAARTRKLSFSGNRHRSNVFKSSPLAQRVISAGSISTDSRVNARSLLGLQEENY